MSEEKAMEDLTVQEDLYGHSGVFLEFYGDKQSDGHGTYQQ